MDLRLPVPADPYRDGTVCSRAVAELTSLILLSTVGGCVNTAGFSGEAAGKLFLQ